MRRIALKNDMRDGLVIGAVAGLVPQIQPMATHAPDPRGLIVIAAGMLAGAGMVTLRRWRRERTTRDNARSPDA